MLIHSQLSPRRFYYDPFCWWVLQGIILNLLCTRIPRQSSSKTLHLQYCIFHTVCPNWENKICFKELGPWKNITPSWSSTQVHQNTVNTGPKEKGGHQQWLPKCWDPWQYSPWRHLPPVQIHPARPSKIPSFSQTFNRQALPSNKGQLLGPTWDNSHPTPGPALYWLGSQSNHETPGHTHRWPVQVRPKSTPMT